MTRGRLARNSLHGRRDFVSLNMMKRVCLHDEASNIKIKYLRDEKRRNTSEIAFN